MMCSAFLCLYLKPTNVWKRIQLEYLLKIKYCTTWKQYFMYINPFTLMYSILSLCLKAYFIFYVQLSCHIRNDSLDIHQIKSKVKTQF
jgi:hypothetical protein